MWALCAQEEEPPNEELQDAMRQASLRNRALYGAHDVSPELRRIPQPAPEDYAAYLERARAISQGILSDSRRIVALVTSFCSGQLDRSAFRGSIEEKFTSLNKGVAQLRGNALLQWMDSRSGSKAPKRDKTPDDVTVACQLLEREAVLLHEKICRLAGSGAQTISLQEIGQTSYTGGAGYLGQLARRISKRTRKL